ncbi:hypothetical protein GEV33_005707 [Tenebrio molitor]|uniref:Uncharacterized protein n=1 Tax=Tenebrio molitor TaxID=7067 RepID=A0A8J6HLZ2_TENMO|nr:hypothetical protein GEV33_005707 [Tenebrio molitor]
MQSNPQPFASCIQDYDILGTGRNSSPPRPGSLTRGANGLGTGDEPDDLALRGTFVDSVAARGRRLAALAEGGALFSAESGYCRPEETRVPGRIRWTRLRKEFFRHGERFLVTSLHTPPSSEKEGRAASLLQRVPPPGEAGSYGGAFFSGGLSRRRLLAGGGDPSWDKVIKGTVFSVSLK